MDEERATAPAATGVNLMVTTASDNEDRAAPRPRYHYQAALAAMLLAGAAGAEAHQMQRPSGRRTGSPATTAAEEEARAQLRKGRAAAKRKRKAFKRLGDRG